MTKRVFSNEWFLVTLIVFFAFIIRTLWLKDNLFFGWEQGRDFLKFKEILSGDMVLIGPKTDIPGVFHGALSYYIPLIPFTLFNGDPLGVLYIYILLNTIAIFFLYKSVKVLYSTRVAYFSAIIYSVSYSSIIYSRWLSNPNLIPSLVILYFFALVMAKKNWKYLIIAVVSWSLMVHLMVVIPIALTIPTLIYVYVEKIKISIRKLLLLGSIIFILLSSYVAFEYRNNFIMTKSMLDDQAGGKFWLSGIGFLDQLFNEAIDNILPIFPRVSFLLLIAILAYAVYITKNLKQNIIVLSFLLAVPTLFFFICDAPLRHFFISASIFLSVIIAVVADSLILDKHKFIGWGLLSVVVIGNLYTVNNRLPENKANFIHHAQRTYLGDMKNLIDYVYSDADGKEFTYDYYSIPYWQEEAWIYMFQWYGMSKYGYAPKMDRTNVNRSEIFYTFIEPNETSEVHLNNWYGEYKKGLDLLDVYESGKLKVEKRRQIDEKE